MFKAWRIGFHVWAWILFCLFGTEILYSTSALWVGSFPLWGLGEGEKYLHVGWVVPRRRAGLGGYDTCTSTGMIVDSIVYGVKVFRFLLPGEGEWHAWPRSAVSR